jgi:hypothetical protein
VHEALANVYAISIQRAKPSGDDQDHAKGYAIGYIKANGIADLL